MFTAIHLIAHNTSQIATTYPTIPGAHCRFSCINLFWRLYRPFIFFLFISFWNNNDKTLEWRPINIFPISKNVRCGIRLHSTGKFIQFMFNETFFFWEVFSEAYLFFWGQILFKSCFVMRLYFRLSFSPISSPISSPLFLFTYILRFHPLIYISP